MTDFAPMMKCVLLASAAMLAPLPMMAAHAQQASTMATPTGAGQISGIVTDKNGNLVAGATVRVEGSNIVEPTNAQGRFTLRGVPAGDQTISVRYFGVDNVTRTPDTKGENPWGDLWFYGNPIFLSIKQ